MQAAETQTRTSDTPSSAEPVHLYAIPSNLVPDVLHQAMPLLEPAIDMSEGRYTSEIVEKALLHREMQLWCAISGEDVVAAVVTQIIRFPEVKSCNILFAGGSRLDEWMSGIVDMIEGWARDLGCAFVDVSGRRGWARKMAHLGYNETWTTVSKRLDHG